MAGIDEQVEPLISFEEIVTCTSLAGDEVCQRLRALYDADYVTGEITCLQSLSTTAASASTKSGCWRPGAWLPANGPAMIRTCVSWRSSAHGSALIRLRDALIMVGEEIATEVILDTYRRLRDGT